MELSEQGLNLLKELEGLKLDAYKDLAGLWTIGYGHCLGRDCTIKKITKEQAEEFLQEDVVKYEEAVTTLVTIPLKQNEFDALVLLTYNIGINGFKKSYLLKCLNESIKSVASKEFLSWVYCNGSMIKGLRKRREKEKALFDGE